VSVHCSQTTRYRCDNCGSSGFNHLFVLSLALSWGFSTHFRLQVSACTVKTPMSTTLKNAQINRETYNHLFDGWVWSDTNPSIPLREGVVRNRLSLLPGCKLTDLPRSIDASQAVGSRSSSAQSAWASPDLKSFASTIATHQPIPLSYSFSSWASYPTPAITCTSPWESTPSSVVLRRGAFRFRTPFLNAQPRVSDSRPFSSGAEWLDTRKEQCYIWSQLPW